MTKDQARDKRLRKLYGVTLEKYNEELKLHKGVCQICLLPPKTKRLSVEHDHSWKRLKVLVKLGGPFVYHAYTLSGRQVYDRCIGRGLTKNEAKRDLRSQLKTASFRGLACYFCNVGLQKFRDNPDNLFRAAEYLRKHQQPTEG